MTAIGIQSTYVPPKSEQLNEIDWMLYLKVRSINKLKTVRRLNEKLNQVLSQSIQTT